MLKSFSRTSFAALAAMLLLFSSCGVVKQTHDFERFVKCKFSIQDVRLLSVAGIDVSKMDKPSDLNFQGMLILAKHFLSGDMPSKMRLSVSAANPFEKQASIAGINWLLMLKQDTLAIGDVNQPVEVPALGKTSFPLVVNFNLAQLIRSGSLDKILQLLISKSVKPAELQQLGLRLKIRPFYMMGSKIKKYPGYISFRPAFRK